MRRAGIYAGGMKLSDEQFAEQLAQQRAAAEARLSTQMEERGMTREGGWRVAEFTRETRGGTEYVLRAVHVWHESPYDLEFVVCLQERDGGAEASVAPEPLRRGLSPPL